MYCSSVVFYCCFLQAYAEAQGIEGLIATVYDKLTKTGTDEVIPPLLIVDIPATANGGSETAFLYGHADKQPLMEDKWTISKPLEPLILELSMFNSFRLIARVCMRRTTPTPTAASVISTNCGHIRALSTWRRTHAAADAPLRSSHATFLSSEASYAALGVRAAVPTAD